MGIPAGGGGTSPTVLQSLASVDDMAVRLGYPLVDAEADRAQAALDDASELIRDVAGITWADDAGELVGVPLTVRSICLAAALRSFTNPQALVQRTIGDSARSYDRSGREGGEVVYLTDEEERRIKRAAGGSTFASVQMYNPLAGADGAEDAEGYVDA
jgi:hypothetical protein